MQPEQQAYADELSLADIVNFLHRGKYLILGCGILGAAIGFGLTRTLHQSYDATFMVEMAKYSDDDRGYHALSTYSVESSALLSTRLSSPATYTSEVVAACGLMPATADRLPAMVTAAPVLNVHLDVASISVRQADAAIAEQCAKAILSLIRDDQDKRLKTIVAERQNELNELQSRYKAIYDSINKIDNRDLYDRAYLSRRDELFYLKGQIDDLERVQRRASSLRLITEPHAAPVSLASRRKMMISAGTIVGLLLGGLVAALRGRPRNGRRTGSAS